MASANPLDRISQFITAQLKLSPARAALTVSRDGPLGGDDVITKVDLAKAKDAIKAVTDSIVGDLRAQVGPVKYVLRVLIAGGEQVGSLTVPARGTADSDTAPRDAGPNNALARIVEQSMIQSLDHHRVIVEQYKEIADGLRGDLLIRDQTIEDLRAALEKANENITALVIHVKAAESEIKSGTSPVESAQALMYSTIAANIGEIPGMVKAFAGKREMKSLPVNADGVRLLRAAASELSDESITAVIKSLYTDHGSVAIAVGQCLTEKERDRMKPAVMAMLGISDKSAAAN